MAQILKNDWQLYLAEEFSKPYYLRLRQFLKKEYRTYRIFPSMYDIFNALHYTPYSEVKAVILGQDPYHELGQAHGLSFSVKPGVPIPPSLKNIYTELQHDLNCPLPNHGCLLDWAKQGVLLLNSVLTVREHQANSHRNKGWEVFTHRVLEELNNRPKPLVFILWGRNAQKVGSQIDTTKHLVLKAPHPSPLSAHRGFFGSRPFSQTNSFLQEHNMTPIDWQIKPI